MKGFKDKEGKFHPITETKGVRRSRDTTTKTTGVRLARNSKDLKAICMMGGKHIRIDSPDKFDPYNACKKCGADIRLKDGEWVTTTYEEREHFNKNKSWERKARDHGIPEKRSGLNKVTILELKKGGKSYDPPLYQVNVNGKGAYFPATRETAKQQAIGMIESAKHYDKQRVKVNK